MATLFNVFSSVTLGSDFCPVIQASDILIMKKPFKVLYSKFPSFQHCLPWFFVFQMLMFKVSQSFNQKGEFAQLEELNLESAAFL